MIDDLPLLIDMGISVKEHHKKEKVIKQFCPISLIHEQLQSNERRDRKQ